VLQHAVLPEVARFAWFLFEAIVKSMLLTLKKAGLLGTPAQHSFTFLLNNSIK
jgi:hypothetical protein